MTPDFYFEDGTPDWNGSAMNAGYCCPSAWAGADCGCGGAEAFWDGQYQGEADALGVTLDELGTALRRRALLQVVTPEPFVCAECASIPF